MLKRVIEYTDYNGVNRKEEFHFNLSKAEIMEMELGVSGGFTEMVNRIINTNDAPALMKIFKDLVLKAYGIKSDDGKRFIKNDELRDEFAQTEAYSVLFMELALDAEKASEFIKGVVPADLAEQAAAMEAEEKNLEVVK